jgi:hypothetical protein
VTHSTAEINGQPLVKGYDDPYNKDCPLFNRFGSDPDKTKQEVDDSSKVIGNVSLFNRFGSDPDFLLFQDR